MQFGSGLFIAKFQITVVRATITIYPIVCHSSISNVVERKNAFLDYKNKRLEKSKNCDFFKEVITNG